MNALITAVLIAVTPPGGIGETVLVEPGVAVASTGATRVNPPSTTTTAPAPSLFAPAGLTGCDEFRWYRQAFGLPSAFDGIAWRESNCRQELGVHTSCCWGWLQLDASLHLQDHRLGWRYRDNCGVYRETDIDGPEPIDKWRHVCAAAQLYAVMGMSPW